MTDSICVVQLQLCMDMAIETSSIVSAKKRGWVTVFALLYMYYCIE